MGCGREQCEASLWDCTACVGPIEVTCLGMREAQMETIADFMARVLIEHRAPEEVAEDVIEFRLPYQKFYDCFDHGLPA